MLVTVQKTYETSTNVPRYSIVHMDVVQWRTGLTSLGADVSSALCHMFSVFYNSLAKNKIFGHILKPAITFACSLA